MQAEIKQSGFDSNSAKTIGAKKKFELFIQQLEDYRILLISGMILIQGCIIVPVTILVISFIEAGLGEITIGILAMNTFGILVTNMAECSIKAILVTFAFSLSSSFIILGLHLVSLL